MCHVCESNLRIHGTSMSQKLFTHFWRFFVAKTIYALRPESFCAWNTADRKVLTFCVSGTPASRFLAVQHISEELKVSCLVQMCLPCPHILRAWRRVLWLQNFNNIVLCCDADQSHSRDMKEAAGTGRLTCWRYYVEGVQGKQEFGLVSFPEGSVWLHICRDLWGEDSQVM